MQMQHTSQVDILRNFGICMVSVEPLERGLKVGRSGLQDLWCTISLNLIKIIYRKLDDLKRPQNIFFINQQSLVTLLSNNEVTY